MDQLDDNSNSEANSHSSKRRPRTSEDFYLFCKIILEHENYETNRQEDARQNAQSPMDSAGSTKSESTTGSSLPEIKSPSPSASEDSVQQATTNHQQIFTDIDSDSYNLITCYCGKPFAARPMIECSKCLTWLHLSCAKVKRNNIPEVFYCYKCKNTLPGGRSVDDVTANISTVNQHDSTPTGPQQHFAETATSSSQTDNRTRKRTSL